MKKDIEWLKKEVWKQDVVVDKGYIYIDDLMNIINKVDKPVIPGFVADWIEKYIEYGYDLYPALKKMENNARAWKETYDWYRKNTREFVSAYLTGEYEVEEEEQKYYALVKGHELIVDEDDNKYWNFDVPNGDVFPSNRFSQDGRYLTRMIKAIWNELGINDSNADFVKVKDVE